MQDYLLLSHIVSQLTPAYGDKDRVFIKTNSAISKGDTANTSCWFFSNNHIGTHIDSAHHFCENGQKTFEIPIRDYFYEKVSIVDIPCTEAKLIDIEDFKTLTTIKPDTELLLIRTGYENYRGEDKYWNDNPGLAPELADYFRELYPALRCVGFDFISLTSWKFRVEGRASHKAFLCPTDGKKSILIIEDMALLKAPNEIDLVVVAPLMVEDGNGGAVTIFAK
ncbi:cyclase family protein [Mucilaginibacter sp. AW1-7]|uniref:cyclase family protein n=1 Tax=Mucilaginibacter sp. AW1-7 TaxID=3349874 RepID=UPI003F739F07